MIAYEVWYQKSIKDAWFETLEEAQAHVEYLKEDRGEYLSEDGYRRYRTLGVDAEDLEIRKVEY